MSIKNQFAVCATDESGTVRWWTGTGFSTLPKYAFLCDSVDFAETAVKIESRCHPDWTVEATRVSGGAEEEDISYIQDARAGKRS